MTEQNIIDSVVEKLNKCPDIKLEKKNDSELEMFCCNNKNFDILLQTDQRENTFTFHFGNFHWHFDNAENGKAYK